MTKVKICGLTDEASVDAAAEAGATWAGFVHFPPSPRHLELTRADALAKRAAGAGLRSVLVVVDPDDGVLAALRDGLDGVAGVQLHGDETAERVAAVKANTGRHVTKALPVRARADLKAATAFAEVANVFLLDAKPPEGADRPGGHGAAFDWSILEGWSAPRPWLLSGGLTPDNVAEAIRITGARAVDVSSGVESAPGVKDPAKIRAFVRAAKDANAEARA
jgi:phosphoribosylanthranilate isomerase